MNIKLIILLFLALLSFLVSLHSGSVPLTWPDVFGFLAGKTLSDSQNFLLKSLRLPRTEAAFIIGASLGAVGLVLQTLLRNPLAEPYTLGLSGGSSLGAVVALYFSLQPSTFWIPALSTVGCLLAVGIVLGLGSRRLEYESRSLILFGIMTSLFFGALVVSGLSVLSPDRLQMALFWLLGEFGTSRDLWISKLGPVLIVGLGMLFWRVRALDALSLGEARAVSLGYSPRLERGILIFICTLLTALSVSIVGLVGFIGLVSPHLARRLMKTARHEILLVAVILIGGVLLTFADSVARYFASSGEIPAGSIAALIGAPVLIFLLTDRRNVAAD